MPLQASRGEIWLVDLNPTKGREQSGQRPVLVVSVNEFNYSPADLLVILPITTKDKGIPFHVPIQPPEGSLHEKSFIKCEDIRSISQERLKKQIGRVKESTLFEVEDRIKILLGL